MIRIFKRVNNKFGLDETFCVQSGGHRVFLHATRPRGKDRQRQRQQRVQGDAGRVQDARYKRRGPVGHIQSGVGDHALGQRANSGREGQRVQLRART